MSYYYWPADWVKNRPGFMNGSGMPMRYADKDGTAIDVYQEATNLVNENGVSYPKGIDAMLDKALGPEGYYGAFGTHYDYRNDGFGDLLLNSAISHNVPLISAAQLLTWIDTRNASSFTSFSWNGSRLVFDVATNAHNIYALLPFQWREGQLASLAVGGVPVAFSVSTIKGVAYAQFRSQPGSYVASYGSPSPVTQMRSAPDGTAEGPPASNAGSMRVDFNR